MRALLASAFVAVVLVACVGDDPSPVPSGGDAGGSSGSSGAAGALSITCDAKTACTGSDHCCGGANHDWIGSACKPDCAGVYELRCDDATDCGAGQVCCYTTDGGARATASFCAAACRAEEKELQLCKLGATGECATGSCTTLTQFSPSGLARCK